MKLHYERFEHNELLCALESNQTICKSLAYMATFKEYDYFEVIPKQHSIEISNEELILSIIFYVGYENNEYLKNLNRQNVHIISFNKIISSMFEFEKLKNEIKFIEPKALFYTSLSFANNEFCDNLKTILEI